MTDPKLELEPDGVAWQALRPYLDAKKERKQVKLNLIETDPRQADSLRGEIKFINQLIKDVENGSE